MTTIGPSGSGASNNNVGRPSNPQPNANANAQNQVNAARAASSNQIGHPSLQATAALIAALGLQVPGMSRDPIRNEFGRDIPALKKAMSSNSPGRKAAAAIENGQLGESYLNNETLTALKDGSFLDSIG